MFRTLLACILCISFQIFSENSPRDIAIKTTQDIISKDNLHFVSDKYNFINTICFSPSCEDSFHIVDVGMIADRYALWQKNLPTITPYYAVKTNNDFVLTSILANFDMGFDCASKKEIEQMINFGVQPSKIIFAHPRKPASAIKYAKEIGVDLLTFDSIEEMHKLAILYPSANLLLRIKTDDSMSGNPLSQKFGATLEESYEILDEGLANHIPIIGVAFHVGSNCTHLESYQKAILDSASIFQYSLEKWNKKLTLLDLGGGWPGTDDLNFVTIAQYVNELLLVHFPQDTKFIAEPGRFFSSQTTTLVMKILGKRRVQEENKFHYYLANGAYGFFLGSLYYAHNQEKILSEGWIFSPLSKRNSRDLFPSLLWGPTCDSGDKILDGILLPEMETEDFIVVENTGSYTQCCETSFNGIPLSKPYYICKIKK